MKPISDQMGKAQLVEIQSMYYRYVQFLRDFLNQNAIDCLQSDQMESMKKTKKLNKMAQNAHIWSP